MSGQDFSSLETRIRAFASNPEEQVDALAMIKVGQEKKDPPEVIMQHLIANILLKFHGMPCDKTSN